MADKKISELPQLLSSDVSSGDWIVVTDSSTNTSKKLDFGEYKIVPITILFLGQSNMRSNADSTGGDMSTSPLVYFWDGDETQAGTQYTQPAVGEYPLDKTPDGGTTYANNYAYAICRDIARRTGRPVYGIMYAEGSHPAVAFVTPAGRTANGWTLDAGLTDLTDYMYPGIANALSAVPGSPSVVDYVFVHQGEANKANSATYSDLETAWSEWKNQWSVVFDELEAAGVYDRTQTRVVFGQMVDSPANTDDRVPQYEAAAELGIDLEGNLSFASSTKLPTVDNLHFTGDGLVALANRAVGAALAPPETFNGYILDLTPDLVLSDAETGGNTATITTVRSQCTVERRMVCDGSTGGRPLGIGGMVTLSGQLVDIDTTGMTSGNDLWVQGLPYPVRKGAVSLFFGTGKTDNVDFKDEFAVQIDNDKQALRFTVDVTTGVQRTMRVSDLSAGAKLFFSITYPARVGFTS